MLTSRLIPASILATGLFFAVSAPANGFLAFAKPKAGHHLDHLHKAAHELKHAHAAVNGKNGGKASQHITAAIGHIEAAIELHKKHHLEQNRTGVTGAIVTAAHHHHHNQLHEALHAAQAAEKHLAAGNGAKASEEINKSHHHVELAMHSHQALIGK
jgi:hypothetical protein